MTSRFLLEAELELTEIGLRYDSAERGLGDRFLSEVEDVVARVVNAPLLWREGLGVIVALTVPFSRTTLRTSFDTKSW